MKWERRDDDESSPENTTNKLMFLKKVKTNEGRKKSINYLSSTFLRRLHLNSKPEEFDPSPVSSTGTFDQIRRFIDFIASAGSLSDREGLIPKTYSFILRHKH